MALLSRNPFPEPTLSTFTSLVFPFRRLAKTSRIRVSGAWFWAHPGYSRLTGGQHHERQLPRNATPGDGLSAAQEAALAALLAGHTVTPTQAAGVDKTTVYRWLRDPYCPGIRQAVRAQLLTLADQAVDCLEGTLALGDSKAALAHLKGPDLFHGPGR
jgi:hypothetical protein